MKKIKYNIDYDSIYSPIIWLILVLSSVKLVGYISSFKVDGDFNYLLILHIFLIIICDFYVSFPYLFKITNMRKINTFKKLAYKTTGDVIKVHHKKMGGNNFTNLEIKYYSKIFKKNMNFFSKQVKYNLDNLDSVPKVEIYEIEENKLPFQIGSSVLTRYSFLSIKKKKVIVFADKIDCNLSFWDRYYNYIVFLAIILLEVILCLYM